MKYSICSITQILSGFRKAVQIPGNVNISIDPGFSSSIEITIEMKQRHLISL